MNFVAIWHVDKQKIIKISNQIYYFLLHVFKLTQAQLNSISIAFGNTGWSVFKLA